MDHLELKRHVRRIIAEGDLETLTSKAVRKMLEEIFQRPLKEHKAQIEKAVLKALAKRQQQEGVDYEEGQSKDEENISKQKKRSSGGPRSAPSPKPAKEKSIADEAEEARLRRAIAQCGLQSKTRWKGVRDLPNAELLEKLRGVLVDALGTDTPSKQQIASYKAKVELAKELDGIDTSNIIGGNGGGDSSRKRPSRAAASERAFCSYTIDRDGIDGDYEELGVESSAVPVTVPSKVRRVVVEETEDEDR
jgi:hypothetical protein